MDFFDFVNLVENTKVDFLADEIKQSILSHISTSQTYGLKASDDRAKTWNFIDSLINKIPNEKQYEISKIKIIKAWNGIKQLLNKEDLKPNVAGSNEKFNSMMEPYKKIIIDELRNIK